MPRCAFNLEIEPRYSPQPITEERMGKYNLTVKLLADLGLVGQLSVRENGMLERGFVQGLEVRKGHFDIFDRERTEDIDFTDPVQRGRLINAVPARAEAAAGIIGFMMRRGIRSYSQLADSITSGTIQTPSGRQSLHIHYEGGGLDYIEIRRHGLMGKKSFFLRGVAADYAFRR